MGRCAESCDAANAGGAVLVLDEVRKVAGWSETVRYLRDADTRRGRPLKIVVLGSAPLLVERGLSESLAGGFEMVRLPHWSFAEMRQAFGWSPDQYLFYGAYPGAAPLIRQPARWARYVRDSLIEPVISRDVLLLSRVDKPALLRRLLEPSCAYSGQILSYTKMLGQLQDAGNTTALVHYLDLLSGAGLVAGLHKHAGRMVRRRASSPKLQVFNTALITAQADTPESRFLGTLGGVGDWGTSGQRRVGGRVPSLLLARAQPRGGLCCPRRRQSSRH